MGSQDRDYYRESEGFGGSLPTMLSYSWPIGAWFGVPVRLHFWLLFYFALSYLRTLTGAGFIAITINNVMLLIGLLFHEFGHRFFAHRVGGGHEEFLLWPAGGLSPPKAPPYPWSTFVAHAGGIVTNAVLCVVCVGMLALLRHLPPLSLFNPLTALMGGAAPTSGMFTPEFLVASFFSANLGLIFVNLLPFYWFDGGYLLQSILWPWTGLYRATNVTCIVGMIVAAPMCLLMLMLVSLFGLMFWGGLLYDSFMRRRQLQASGTGELDSAIAYSASLTGDGPPGRRPRRSPSRDSARRAAKVAATERKEKEEIDTILAKVHAKGMQSLNWLERRALRRATERQRRAAGG